MEPLKAPRQRLIEIFVAENLVFVITRGTDSTLKILGLWATIRSPK